MLLGLRTAPKEDDNVSSPELVFGSPVTFPDQLLATPEHLLAVFLEEIINFPPPPIRKWSYDKAVAAPSPALMAASFVYIRRDGCIPPLSPPYKGPYAVMSAGPKLCTVVIGGRHETALVDCLKPHNGSAPVRPVSQRPMDSCPMAASQLLPLLLCLHWAPACGGAVWRTSAASS